jgi:hypothetical protein
VYHCERQRKTIGPKLDNFLKHQGCHKAKESRPKVDVGGFFFTKDSIHVKNEQCYTATDHPSSLNRLQADVLSKHRQKYVQLVVVYHLLANGRPMTNYENSRNLFQLLKVKFVSRKHWTNRAT